MVILLNTYGIYYWVCKVDSIELNIITIVMMHNIIYVVLTANMIKLTDFIFWCSWLRVETQSDLPASYSQKKMICHVSFGLLDYWIIHANQVWQVLILAPDGASTVYHKHKKIEICSIAEKCRICLYRFWHIVWVFCML